MEDTAAMSRSAYITVRGISVTQLRWALVMAAISVAVIAVFGARFLTYKLGQFSASYTPKTVTVSQLAQHPEGWVQKTVQVSGFLKAGGHQMSDVPNRFVEGSYYSFSDGQKAITVYCQGQKPLAAGKRTLYGCLQCTNGRYWFDPEPGTS